MHRPLVSLLPSQSMFFASRSATELPQTGFIVDRGVLPMSVAAENDHALMKNLMRHIRFAVAGNLDMTTLILHHPSRGGRNLPRGAGVIGQDVDGYWSLMHPKGRPPSDATLRPTLLQPKKSRRLSGIKTYRVTPDKTRGYRLMGTVETEVE